MGMSSQLRLRGGGTWTKAEPERAGKIEAEQWACGVQPVRIARLRGSHACGLCFVPPLQPWSGPWQAWVSVVFPAQPDPQR